MSAATSRAERETLKTASSWGTDCGWRLRASAVDMTCSGTSTSGETPRCTISFLKRGPSGVTQAIVRPPKSAGATLSGWPSMSFASASSAWASSSTTPSSRPLAAMMPETMAAPDEPMPRPCGMLLRATRFSPGSATPTDSKVWAIARTTRLLSSVGTSPAPTPTTSTVAPGSSRTLTRSSS